MIACNKYVLLENMTSEYLFYFLFLLDHEK